MFIRDTCNKKVFFCGHFILQFVRYQSYVIFLFTIHANTGQTFQNQVFIKSFHASIPFMYPLKGASKWSIGEKWVNQVEPV